MTNDKKNDDALERLKRATQEAQETSKEEAPKGDPLSMRTIHDKAEDGLDTIGAGLKAAKKYVKENKTIVGAAHAFYGRVKDTYASFRQASKTFNRIAEAGEAVATFAQPLTKRLLWFGGKLKDTFMWSAYQREPGQFLWNGFKNEDGKFNWNPVTHIKGSFIFDDDGDLIFDAKRLGKTAMLTVFAAASLNIAVQGVYFHSTKFEETVRISGTPTEIIPGEEYSVTACDKIQCRENESGQDNSMYYRIKESWVFPTLLFPEDDVFAKISTNDVCHFKGYGLYLKHLKKLHKRLELYPSIYEADCRPLTEKEKELGIMDTKLFLPGEQEAAPSGMDETGAVIERNSPDHFGKSGPEAPTFE